VVATHDVTPLAAAIRSRDEFLTTVSHELRTPLTNVIGYLELIEDRIDIAHLGIASEFGIVQRNTHRLLRLINDLLTTAEGQASLERRPFDIAELVANALNTIRPAATERQIRVVTPLMLPVVAEIDADRIADVLDKLLSNALKFNRDGGEIAVTVESRGDEAVVRISDTGIGIAPADLRRIFERFFRSSTAREGEVAGSGLGLSTAKVIVDSHLGTMTAESVIGEGTTIELRLPVTVVVDDAKSASASSAGWTLG
jgi:signal transduction histidine kinase